MHTTTTMFKSLYAFCTCLQPWHGTARGLRSCGAININLSIDSTATRMQLAGRNVSCKQRCACGLQKHIICTEDVTVRHAAKATYRYVLLSSWDIIFHLPHRATPERMPTIDVVDFLCLRLRYAATAAALAATQLSIYVSIPREVYV